MAKGIRSLLNIALAVLCMVSVVLWWQMPLLVVGALASITVALLWLNWQPRLPLIYLGAFIGGPIAEIACITAGVWQYSAPDFLGIPMWLPFLWGNAALFIARWRQTPHT